MRAVASTLSGGLRRRKSKKAPPGGGALMAKLRRLTSSSLPSSSFFFFHHLLFLVVLHFLRRHVVAGGKADAAPCAAFQHALNADGRCTELDAFAADPSLGRRAGREQERGASKQPRDDDEFTHWLFPPNLRNAATTPLEPQNIKGGAARQAPAKRF